MFKKAEVKKPVENVMFWWLNHGRPFYIGDEYRIDLMASDRTGSAIKISVTNLKTMQDLYPQDLMGNKKSLPKKKVEIDLLQTLETLTKSAKDE